MSGWLVASGVLLASLIPCAVTCLRGDPVDRLVGLELTGVVAVLLFLALSIVSQRPVLVDLALTSATLSLGSGVVFARFFERWL